MKRYIGLADCYGIESFMPYDTNVRTTDMLIRAYANSHRKAIVFKAKFESAHIKAIYKLLEQQQTEEAFLLIKALYKAGNVKDLQISAGKKRYYDDIPDETLDPYNVKTEDKGGNEDA